MEIPDSQSPESLDSPSPVDNSKDVDTSDLDLKIPAFSELHPKTVETPRGTTSESVSSPAVSPAPAPPTQIKEDGIVIYKAKKAAEITARNEALEKQIAQVKEELDKVTAELKNPAPATVAKHIHLLHSYNEIRDIGQGLLGLIADGRNVRIRDLYESGEFGVGSKD